MCSDFINYFTIFITLTFVFVFKRIKNILDHGDFSSFFYFQYIFHPREVAVMTIVLILSINVNIQYLTMK